MCEHSETKLVTPAPGKARKSVSTKWQYIERKTTKCDIVLMRVSFMKSQDQPSIGHGDLAQVFSSGGLAQV